MIRALLLGLLLLSAPAQAQNVTALPAPSSGAVGGDLSGSLPNPVVAKISGTAVGAAATLGIGSGLASAGGNIITSGGQRVLCSIRSANFNIVTDQACAIPAAVTAWAPTAIWATNCSANLTTAAGGVYPTTAKGGTPLVAAVQVYTALTGATVILPLTLAANIATTRFAVNTVYLSLTLGQGTAATCDFYVVGLDLT